MYSVVLMVTLTAGSATPDWHHGGCWGGHGGGCFGACYGGCYGGGYGDPYGGCYGCWGGYGNWYFGCPPQPVVAGAAGYGMMGGTVAPATGNGFEQLGKPQPNKNGEKESMAPTRGQLVVELPANANLFIDNVPVKVAAGVHTLNTPALAPGQLFYYEVRIETIRDGKPISQTRRVIVRAGHIARADFKELPPETVRTAQVR